MARIRSIKPEFWSSAQVMECSPTARLLFIGLWNFCDDHGRHPTNAKTIKALVFPADNYATEDIRRLIDELSSNGLVSIYVVDGKEYLQVTGWHHQKIDRPQSPKYPSPVAEHSPNRRRTIATDEGEDKGKEEGRDSSEPSGSDAASASAEIYSLPVDAKTALFREALPLLAKFTGKSAQSLRSLAGKWLKQANDDADRVSLLIGEAVRDNRADAVAWIERCLKPADPDAMIYRNVL